jgi:excisionase family DNA binding protein
MDEKLRKQLAAYLSPGRVAEKLGVTRQQVDKWLSDGRIPYVLVGETRYVAPGDAKTPAPARRGPKPKPDKAIRGPKKTRK